MKWLLISIVLIPGCKSSQPSYPGVLVNDCSASVDRHRPMISGIKVLEEFQKSKFDIDLIFVDRYHGSEAYFSFSRLYLNDGGWFYMNSRDTSEVFLTQADVTFIRRVSVEDKLISFTCQTPSSYDHFFVMLFAKHGNTVGLNRT